MNESDAKFLVEAAGWNKRTPDILLRDIFRMWVAGIPNADDAVPWSAFSELRGRDPLPIAIEDAARFLSQCGSSLDLLAHTGGLPGQRTDRPIRLSAQDLFAWLGRAYESTENLADPRSSVA
jgi:hypothetical protein